MTRPETREPDSVREALRRLPKVPASRGFTTRLRERLASETAPRPALSRRLAVAAALIAVLAAFLWLRENRNRELDLQRQRAALETRHQDLRRELARVRERAERSPRLYLGTASDIDLVLDLEPWMERPLAIQPAAYTTSRP